MRPCRLPGVAIPATVAPRLGVSAALRDEGPIDDGLEIDEEFELYYQPRATLWDQLQDRRRAWDAHDSNQMPYETSSSLVPESTLATVLFLLAVAINYLVIGPMLPDVSPSGAGSGGSLYVTVALFLALGAWALRNDRSRDE